LYAGEKKYIWNFSGKVTLNWFLANLTMFGPKREHSRREKIV